MSKFSITRAPPWVYLVICLAAGAAIGFVGESTGLNQKPLTAAAITAVFMALLIPVVVLYWRRLDEAAREAHKFAWYWGGSAGMVVVVVIFHALMAPGSGGAGGAADSALLATHSPRALLGAGMICALMAQVAGYLVAWVGWWIARR